MIDGAIGFVMGLAIALLVLLLVWIIRLARKIVWASKQDSAA